MNLLVLFSYTLFIVIVLLSLILIYFKHCYGFWKKRGIVFVKPSFPFGNFRDVALGKRHIGPVTVDIYRELKKFGNPFSGIYVLAEAVVMPTDPELIKRILIKDFNYFNSRGMYLDEENDPLSAHMIALYGAKWRSVRGKVNSAFSSGKLKTLFPTLETVVLKLINLLEEKSKFSEPVEVKELMAQYTTEVVGSCIIGMECNSLTDPNDQLRKTGKLFFKVETLEDMVRNVCAMNYPKLMKFFNIKIAQKEVDKYFKKIIKEIVDYREANNVEKNDFMHMLLQLKNKGRLDDTERNEDLGFKFTLEDITAQCFGFFMAGFDSSSSTLAFLLYEISKSPQIQERIRKEIIAVLETTNVSLDYDSLSQLAYLDQVIAETLRKYTTLPVLNRECNKDYPIPGGNYVIKKGQKVFVPLMALNNDPEYYPDPDKFDPDRFGPEGKSLENLPYMPFGDGPRYCIGKRFALMLVKLAVASIVSKFALSLNPKTVEPIEYSTKNVVILCPKNAVLVDFERV